MNEEKYQNKTDCIHYEICWTVGEYQDCRIKDWEKCDFYEVRK